MARRVRGFCFTINNYTDADKGGLEMLAAMCEYMVVGKETGEEGTPHYQGYVYFKNKKSFKQVKDVIPRAHIEVAKGNAQQNRDYCIKGGDFEEFGNVPKQGNRGDLSEVLEFTTMRDVVLNASSYQAIRMAEKRLVYLEPKRDWKPRVVWIYGNTGLCKTRGIHEAYPDLFRPQSFKWWDGYDGHEEVLVDDFRGSFCKFSDLLLLIDRYPYQVEVKGGMRQLRAKRMFFTSCYHPVDCYKDRTDEDLQQLIRRIDWICLMERDACGAAVCTVMKRPVRDEFKLVL